MYKPAFPHTHSSDRFAASEVSTPSVLCWRLKSLTDAENRGRCDALPVTLKQKYYPLASCNGPQRSGWYKPSTFTSWVWMHHTQAQSCVTVCRCISGWAKYCFSCRLESISVYECLLLHRKTQSRLLPTNGLPAVRPGHPKAPGLEPSCRDTFGTLNSEEDIVLNYK